MDTSVPIAPEPAAPCRRRRAAFTLVEVTLSIGIVAFAFVSVFGLLPTGMTTFRKAIDTTVGGQITQLMINDAQQTDFDQLITDPAGTGHAGTSATFCRNIRYFDEIGTEVVPATANMPTADELSRIAYWVNTRVTPMTASPQTTPVASVNLATITVEIVANPGNAPLALPTAAPDDQNAPLRNLWVGNPQNSLSHPGMIFLTRCALVSRNQ